MALINKDEVKGKIVKGKGWVKDKAGEMTGNTRLEAEGEADRVAGETQETWGEVKRGVSNVIEDVADKINR